MGVLHCKRSFPICLGAVKCFSLIKMGLKKLPSRIMVETMVFFFVQQVVLTLAEIDKSIVCCKIYIFLVLKLLITIKEFKSFFNSLLLRFQPF